MSFPRPALPTVTCERIGGCLLRDGCCVYCGGVVAWTPPAPVTPTTTAGLRAWTYLLRGRR